MTSSHEKQDRFEFGRNWASFLQTLNEERIRVAEDSLKAMLAVQNLNGKSFLDIGSGSGLFSLVAMRLGAEQVYSLDYDSESVNCTQYLKDKFFSGNDRWTIEKGDVLDKNYMKSVGEFDIVYSWGVLHHTGDMWQALNNAAIPVAGRGRLFIAIYNDQGRVSRFWLSVKQTYCSLPDWLRPIYVCVFLPYFESITVISNVLQKRVPWRHWKEPNGDRGMSRWHDIRDWMGGLPFEVAKPERIFDFYRQSGFQLDRLITVGGRLGNNQFVFTKRD